jgi:arylsulfatase A-like enzyme
MKKYIAVIYCSLIGLASASALVKPNIVIFYVDDLGWQDIQLNDLDDPCLYETPNMIKLAEVGINFTRAYSPAPTCAPSRAGILTGQHPAKIGMTHVDLSVLDHGKKDSKLVSPYLQGPLDLTLLTLADALKANGYRTGHSGKWHVGSNAASYGFEVVNQDRGIHRGLDDRTRDFAKVDDEKYPLSQEKYAPLSDRNPEGISYPYDEVTESAINFMEKNKLEPFFLNLCHWMVHVPIVTRNGKLLEYYCDKLGQSFPPKRGDISLPGQQNPYFASMVTTVDWSLGKIVDYLSSTDDPRNEGKKLIETTYIFLSSDNGGAEIKGKEIISDNAPLKYGKKHPEEGGVRVPMIVTGPGIKGGSIFNEPVSQLDYFPTILTVTGSTIDEANHKKLSGLDITPILEGKSEKVINTNGVERDHLFWHFPHNGKKSGILSGDYKLYKRFETNDYELYQITKNGKRHDLEEMKDLVKNPAFSQIVESLSKQLEASLKANNAEGPYLNPNFKLKEKASATLTSNDFDDASRLATVTIEKGVLCVEKAYVIYRNDPEAPKSKSHRVEKGLADDTKRAGMRDLATISEDGTKITATIPEGLTHYCFSMIDSNNYRTFSPVYAIGKGVLKKAPTEKGKKKK